MRSFLSVKTNTEYFASLQALFLQQNSGEHFGNINLGTFGERFQWGFLTVKTKPKQHRNKVSLYIRPPDLLKYLYRFGHFYRERWDF